MNRDSSTLGGPAVAEFVADVSLCPSEAHRIRYVSDPCNANVMLAVGQKFVAENVAAIGLFFNFCPMLYKQSTYTKTEFCVQQKCPIRILKRMLSNTKITRDHKKSVFPVVVPPVTCQVFPQDPDYPPMQVAVTNSSSVQQKLRMRRLHHRV